MRHRLELKIPPAIVTLCFAGFMWFAASPTTLQLTYPFRLDIALALVIAGLSLCLVGIIAFQRANTTVNPIKPESASTLVNTGIYRYTRNPMYLGMLFGLLAWAVFLSNAAAFMVAPLFVLYLNRFQIIPEERALAARFGKDFAAYTDKVRRWL